MTQWMRKITVEYGQEIGSALGPSSPWSLTSQEDSDFRIQFRFSRTNTNRADSGRVSIYNLPLDFADAIRNGVQEANEDRARIMEGPRFKNDIEGRNRALKDLSEANLVKVYAGYQDGTKLIFTGDVTDLDTKSMSSDTDSITSIDLGDTIVPLKYGWLSKSFGGGATLDQILNSVISASGIPGSQQAIKFISNTIAGVEVAEFRNGLVVVGGIQRSLDDLVAMYGVQWFVRDGEIYFMPRGALIDDFALRLDEGDNVLRPISNMDGDRIKFTMLLDGDMLPGRGFKIFDTDGLPKSDIGYRADTVDYVGDTHGNPWYCLVQGSRIDDNNFPPAFSQFTRGEAIDTGAVAIP